MMKKIFNSLFVLVATASFAQVGVTVHGDALLYVNNQTLLYSKGKLQVDKDNGTANGVSKVPHLSYADMFDGSAAFDRDETTTDVLNYGFIKVDGDIIVDPDARLALKYDNGTINDNFIYGEMREADGTYVTRTGTATAESTGVGRRVNDVWGQLMTGASVSGDIYAEDYQYVGENGYKWIYFSTPFMGYKMNDLKEKQVRTDGDAVPAPYTSTMTARPNGYAVLKMNVRDQLWDFIEGGNPDLEMGTALVYMAGPRAAGEDENYLPFDGGNQLLSTLSGEALDGVTPVTQKLYYGQPAWSNEYINGHDGARRSDNAAAGWNLLGNPFLSNYNVCNEVNRLLTAGVLAEGGVAVYRDTDAAMGLQNPFFLANCATGSGYEQAQIVKPFEAFQVKVSSTRGDNGASLIPAGGIEFSTPMADLEQSDVWNFNPSDRTFFRSPTGDDTGQNYGGSGTPGTHTGGNGSYNNPYDVYARESVKDRTARFTKLSQSNPNNVAISALGQGGFKWDRVYAEVVSEDGNILDWSEVIFKKGFSELNSDFVDASKQKNTSSNSVAAFATNEGKYMLSNANANKPGTIVPLKVNTTSKGAKIRFLQYEDTYGYDIYVEDKKTGEFFKLTPFSENGKPVYTSFDYTSKDTDRFAIHYGSKPSVVATSGANGLRYGYDQFPGVWQIDWDANLVKQKGVDKIIWKLYNLNGELVAWVDFNPAQYSSNKFTFTHGSNSINKIDANFKAGQTMIVNIEGFKGATPVVSIEKKYQR